MLFVAGSCPLSGIAKKYAKNEAKLRAAEEFCKNKGWHFLIQDEYDLGIKKRRKKHGKT